MVINNNMSENTHPNILDKVDSAILTFNTDCKDMNVAIAPVTITDKIVSVIETISGE